MINKTVQMSATTTTVSLEMSAVLKVIQDLESRLAALRRLVDPEGLSPAPASAKKQRRKKDPDAPKREPNAWIKFTQHVRTVLKEGDAEIKMAKHFMKFAKHVQTELGAEATAAQILETRKTWEPPAAGEESGDSSASSAEEGGAASGAAAKRGRKPMTDEQKAAAKEAREEAKKKEALSAAEESAAAKKKVVAKKK